VARPGVKSFSRPAARRCRPGLYAPARGFSALAGCPPGCRRVSSSCTALPPSVCELLLTHTPGANLQQGRLPEGLWPGSPSHGSKMRSWAEWPHGPARRFNATAELVPRLETRPPEVLGSSKLRLKPGPVALASRTARLALSRCWWPGGLAVLSSSDKLRRRHLGRSGALPYWQSAALCYISSCANGELDLGES
jgi:hypothetical protein